MEILLRVFAILQNLLCFILEPLYWFKAKMKSTVPLQTIRNPILTWSATELARKIRTGELKCEELIEVYSFRCRRVDMKLCAVTGERYEAALQDAELVDERVASGAGVEESPLLGVPVAVGGSLNVSGVGGVASDAAVMAALRRAGAIPLVTTAADLRGHTTSANNPYHYQRTVGGGDGGQASLIGGAGAVVGIGVEWLGSVRGPAMYTGIFAHRPTQGVVVGEGGRGEVGPVARYAEDLPLMLGVLAATTDKDNADKLRLGQQVPISEIEVFYMTEVENSLGVPRVEKQIKQAVIKAVEYLKNCNCKVQKVSFKEMSHCIEISRAVLYNSKNLGDIIEEHETANHKECSNFMEEITNSLTTLSTYSMVALYHKLLKTTNGLISRKRIPEYLKEKEILRTKLNTMLGDSGVLLLPTQPSSAPYHGQWLLRPLQSIYCDIVSALGLPATTVPMGLNSKGLPIGIQVVAAPYQDRLCLAVARQLETAFGGWVPPPSLKPPSE